MARYGAGASLSGINAANNAWAAIGQTGTTQRLLLRQVMVNVAVAPSTAPSWYLTRITGLGTPAGTLAGLAFDENEAAAVGEAAWWTSSNQPTITNTANKIASGGLAVTAGGAFVWSFWDVPLIVRATAGYGIALCNVNASGGTAGTFVVTFIWDE
jgi:hypothetical protein